MKAKCPLGHIENLDYREVHGRLRTNDFRCQTEDCSREVSIEVERHLWERFFPDAITFPDDVEYDGYTGREDLHNITMETHNDIKETVEEHEGVLNVDIHIEGERHQDTGMSVEVDSIERFTEIKEILEESEVSYSINSVVGAFTLSGE